MSGHLVEMTKRQASPHFPPLAPSCPARQGPSTPSWPRDHWGLRGETQPPTSSAAPLLAPCPSSGRTPFFNKGKARSSHPSCSSLPPLLLSLLTCPGLKAQPAPPTLCVTVFTSLMVEVASLLLQFLLKEIGVFNCFSRGLVGHRALSPSFGKFHV